MIPAHQLEVFGDGKDVLQRVELELVEVFVGGALHLELPTVDTLRRDTIAERWIFLREGSDSSGMPAL